MINTIKLDDLKEEIGEKAKKQTKKQETAEEI